MSARLTGSEAQAILDGMDDETSEPAELRVEGEPVFDASGEQVFLHTGRARVVQSAERALREVVTLERERDDAAALAARYRDAAVRVLDTILGDRVRPPPGVVSGVVTEMEDVGRFVRRELGEKREAALASPELLATWACDLVEEGREDARASRNAREREVALYATLHLAVEALHGDSPGAFEWVTPHAMRAVMSRRGWTLAGVQRLAGDSAVVAFEVHRHETALGVCKKRHTVRSVLLPVERLADYPLRVVDWCEAVASRHGDVAPAVVLAEALMEVPPWNS